MLNRPTRKASATDRPVKISGGRGHDGLGERAECRAHAVPIERHQGADESPRIADRAAEERPVGLEHRRPARADGLRRVGCPETEQLEVGQHDQMNAPSTNAVRRASAGSTMPPSAARRRPGWRSGSSVVIRFHPKRVAVGVRATAPPAVSAVIGCSCFNGLSAGAGVSRRCAAGDVLGRGATHEQARAAPWSRPPPAVGCRRSCPGT